MSIRERGPQRDHGQLERVFVYGTLMEGFGNYRCYLASRVSGIAKGNTAGLLYHLPEGYPALVRGDKRVWGEVMVLTDASALKKMDQLEGYVEGRASNLYERERRIAVLENGEAVECWAYIYGDPGYAWGSGIEIPDGDWRKFMERRGM